jgi:hypothetical protein
VAGLFAFFILLTGIRGHQNPTFELLIRDWVTEDTKEIDEIAIEVVDDLNRGRVFGE